MTEAVHFGRIAESIKNHQPVSDAVDNVLYIKGQDTSTVEVLRRLNRGLMDRDVPPSKCVYYLPPSVYDSTLRNHLGPELGDAGRDYPSIADGIHFDGALVTVSRSLRDTVLYLMPDAVGLEGEVYNPSAVGYAEVDVNDD